MDVSELVSQMQDTLATIHSTLQSLDPKVHDAKLDDLEKRRDDAIRALTAAFSAEAESLDQKRKAEREEIGERRRKEDEERDRRRREEDNELAAKDREEDQARDRKLKEDSKDVEQETDELMSRVEEEAHMATTEGREKLQALQERRRELNRLIEDQLEMTLPTLPVVPIRRRPTRASTSPSSLTDRKVPETSRTVGAPAHPGPDQQETYKADEVPQEVPNADSSINNVSKSSLLLPGNMDNGDEDSTEHVNYAPLQEETKSQTEPPGPADWPLTQEDAATNTAHHHQEASQEPTAASETNSPSNDVTAESHEVGAIPSTMNHGVDISSMEEDEAPQEQVSSNRSSTEALPSTGIESAEPLDEDTALLNEEEYQANHDNPPAAHLSEPDATSQTSFAAAEVLPEPKHQFPGHHPELSMLSTEAELAHFYYHDLSDVEEVSPASSPREKEPDEDAYLHVSEASGNPPFSAHADTSGYLSENADASNPNFGHRGESYIEEDEVHHLERVHSTIPQDVRTEPGAFVHTAEGQGQGDTATDADFEESLPRLHPLSTTEMTLEPLNMMIQDMDENEGTSEQEKAHTSEPGAEKSVVFEQETVVDTASPESEPAREHYEAVEPEIGGYDALGLQQTGVVETGPEIPDPSGGGTSAPIDHVPSPEPDDHDYDHDHEEAEMHEETTGTGGESPVDYMYRGYRRSSPELHDIKPQIDPGERDAESGEDEPHQSPGHRGHEDDDTDTESQRFVTPLPSQNSLRAFYQEENTPHNVDTDDYIGRQYYEEDPRQYESAHQHSTTVHGEDHLFDDTDQSEDHGLPEDDEVESVATSQPGSPALLEQSGQAEETDTNREIEPQRIPEVTVKSPTSPRNPARTSWMEEVDDYFEEEESGSPPETPPPSARGVVKDEATSNTAQGDLPHELPVSTGSGLSASLHNTERPHTPTTHESLPSSEDATPEPSAALNVTNTPWRADDAPPAKAAPPPTQPAAASSNACAASSNQGVPAPTPTTRTQTQPAQPTATTTAPTTNSTTPTPAPTPTPTPPPAPTPPSSTTKAPAPAPPFQRHVHASRRSLARRALLLGCRTRGGIDHARAWRGSVGEGCGAAGLWKGEEEEEEEEGDEEEGEEVVIALGLTPTPTQERQAGLVSTGVAATTTARVTGGNYGLGVTVLENNFDRLGVHSITAQVSVDETGLEEEEEEAVERGKGDMMEGARRLRAGPDISSRWRGSDTGVRQRPRYTEAVGEARLAWMWVEGWRARLRKGGDVVEKARWEWRLDSPEEVSVSESVPIVMVGEPEIVGGDQG
ncbi:uncharacterized protein B0H64DRAFT_452680 [Chaetomium fimeti]|uniref:Uncharacterized protein n=1 Tax=Chaetomium fimeti TaxID=1854472 RepID=A0AAE0LM67_9PEZI|nr:hypothetical protein B0H64DRAFT_452680 [Chaetomium fimeti]